jgi:hypothetical protein
MTHFNELGSGAQNQQFARLHRRRFPLLTTFRNSQTDRDPERREESLFSSLSAATSLAVQAEGAHAAGVGPLHLLLLSSRI